MARGAALRTALTLLLAGAVCTALGLQEGTCSVDDTWGLPDNVQSSPLYASIAPSDLKYDWRWATRKLSSIPNFVLNWYPDQATFQQFKGVDLNPDRHFEYSARRKDHLPYWAQNLTSWNRSNGPAFFKGALLHESKDIPQSDGSFLRVQKVGPLVSTGNYDFWQLGWKDVFGLSEVFAKHPEGIIFDMASTSAVFEDGTPVPFPPIHMHHIHIGPRIGVKAKEPSVPFLAVEQHGDYQCVSKDGGVQCFFERSPDGFGKKLDMPLDLEGEINDARPGGSPPMTWYYQVTLRYRPLPAATSLTPYSQMFVVGPGPRRPWEQLSSLLVFDVPTATESLYWYTGTMPEDGTLLRNKLHSHGFSFERAWFFHASPEDLGLTTPKLRLPSGKDGCGRVFKRHTGCVPIALREAGFSSSDALRNYLVANMAEAATRHDQTCSLLAGNNRTHCANVRPKMVCEACVGSSFKKDAASGVYYKYDRRAPTHCKPWAFERGAVFTTVGTFKKVDRPPAPTSSKVPKVLPMHLHWVLSFVPRTAPPTYYYGDQDVRDWVKPSELGGGLAVDRPFGRYMTDAAGAPCYSEDCQASPVGLVQAGDSDRAWAPKRAAGGARVGGGGADLPARRAGTERFVLLLALAATVLGAACSHACLAESAAARCLRSVKCCPPLPPKLVSHSVQYGAV